MTGFGGGVSAAGFFLFITSLSLLARSTGLAVAPPLWSPDGEDEVDMALSSEPVDC